MNGGGSMPRGRRPPQIFPYVTVITPVNELRNARTHLFRGISMGLARIRFARQLGFMVLIAAQSTVFSTGPASRASATATDLLAHRKSRLSHSSGQTDDPKTLSPGESQRIIASRARQVLLSLKAGNVAKFSTFVHPQKGVRFSPYASVIPDEDRLVKRKQLLQMWTSTKRYKWGGYDGSGDPIWLTFKNYHRHFIFDHDFSRAQSVTYNPETMSHGNTPNNIRAIYPQAIAVEYYFPGFDSKRSGMDWSSLWLVFEKKGSDWYLVGIVHDEWTI